MDFLSGLSAFGKIRVRAGSRGDKSKKEPPPPPIDGEKPQNVEATLKKAQAIVTIVDSWTPQDVGIDSELRDYQVAKKGTDSTPEIRTAQREEFNRAVAFFNALGAQLKGSAPKLSSAQIQAFLKTPLGQAFYTLWSSRGGMADRAAIKPLTGNETMPSGSGLAHTAREIGSQYQAILQIRDIIASQVLAKRAYDASKKAYDISSEQLKRASSGLIEKSEDIVKGYNAALSNLKSNYAQLSQSLARVKASTGAALNQAKSDLAKRAALYMAKKKAPHATEAAVKAAKGFETAKEYFDRLMNQKKPRSDWQPKYQGIEDQLYHQQTGGDAAYWWNQSQQVVDQAVANAPVRQDLMSLIYSETSPSIAYGGGGMPDQTIPDQSIPDQMPPDQLPPDQAPPDQPPSDFQQTQPPPPPTIDWSNVAGLGENPKAEDATCSLGKMALALGAGYVAYRAVKQSTKDSTAAMVSGIGAAAILYTQVLAKK